MWFFVLLLMFAAVLTMIEIASYGRLVGFVSINSANSSVPTSSNQDILIFGIYAFLFILVFAFMLDFMKKYHERIIAKNHHAEEKPFRRKMIHFDADWNKSNF